MNTARGCILYVILRSSVFTMPVGTSSSKYIWIFKDCIIIRELEHSIHQHGLLPCPESS